MPRAGKSAVTSWGRVYGGIVLLVVMSFLAKMMGKSSKMVSQADALPGRSTRMSVPSRHEVLGTPLDGDFSGMSKIQLALGCFWGAERVFWKMPGVVSTAVGYAGGYTPNPTYEEVCSGRTGHAEVVRVVYDPEKLSTEKILAKFWESHNPTQGNRQGNDVGTQYRSAIYYHDDAQKELALQSRKRYEEMIAQKGYHEITTDIEPAKEFYFAEGYHQQYLHKNPGGYCGLGGTGVTCPLPFNSNSHGVGAAAH